MPKRKPEALFYIYEPIEGDSELEIIEENVDQKVFESLNLDAKVYNRDYEAIYGEKVFDHSVKRNQDSKDITQNMDSEAQKKSSCDPSLKILDAESLKIETGVKMVRRVIGFVTSGGYVLNRGSGMGLATVETSVLESVNVNKGFLWVRNPSSTQYHKATITKIY